MKKSNFANGKKNSKPLASVSKQEVQITDETICVVSFNLAGAFKDRQSNAGTKEEIRKMLASPFIETNKKGRFVCAGYGLPGRKMEANEPLPKNYYEGSKTYKPCTYHKCTQRRVYNSESLRYLSSTEARPFGFTKGQWENMSIVERLTAQFASEATSMNYINPGFTFEFVN